MNHCAQLWPKLSVTRRLADEELTWPKTCLVIPTLTNQHMQLNDP